MKVDMLFNAIGKVDDAYIVSAGSRIESSSQERTSGHGIIYRKAFLTAAAILLLLMSSFTVAMAANEEFRNFIFHFFHISTTEHVLPLEEEPDHSEQIENIGSTSIEDTVNVEYIRIDGKFDYNDGVIYSYDDESGEFTAAYTVENAQISQLEEHCESFEYTWNELVYQISFSWYEIDGIVHTMARNYDLDTSAAWYVNAYSGNSELVAVELTFGAQIEYRVYPLLYNIRTHEVIDVLDGCEEIKAQNILEVAFTSDLSSMLITCGEVTIWYDENSRTVYYFDMEKQTLQALSEWSGMKVMDAWFIDNDTIGCLWYDAEDNYTCRTLSVTTGDLFELFSDTANINWFSESGIMLTGGRYGLYIDEDSGSYVYDFKTGDKAIIEDFQYYQDAKFLSLNRAGNKMLFYKPASSADSFYHFSSIGVLDLEKHSIILFDREGYEIREEHSISWFDNDRVAIWASTDEYGYLYLFTVNGEV